MFARLKNQLIARVITRFPNLAKKLTDAYKPWESDGGVPWTPLHKPLSACKLALVTTSGIHHQEQEPFDMNDPDGDTSWRVLDLDSLPDNFKITHDYYDHADAEKDLNIVFPFVRLQEFVKAGIIGKLAKEHYSLMGHIDGRKIPELIEKSAKQVAARLKADNVDIVLLTPA